MEKKIRKVIRSQEIVVDLANIYQYGLETFGITSADIFLEELNHMIHGLSFQFDMYPECRFLPTKSKIYRNIIIGKYLILYRVKQTQVQVLQAFYNSQSPVKIKKYRNIKI